MNVVLCESPHGSCTSFLDVHQHRGFSRNPMFCKCATSMHICIYSSSGADVCKYLCNKWSNITAAYVTRYMSLTTIWYINISNYNMTRHIMFCLQFAIIMAASSLGLSSGPGRLCPEKTCDSFSL